MDQTPKSARQDASHAPDAMLEHLLRQRHSVRGFLARPVPLPLLTRVFELAQLAPSNCNAQPWRVDVLSGEAANRMRAVLSREVSAGAEETPDYPITVTRPGEYRVRQIEAAKALFSATGVERGDLEARQGSFLRNFRFFEAPHVAFLSMPDWCGPREAADVGMFAQSLMLALTAHGLASCPQSALSHYAAIVKRELDIPADMRILFGLSFGYEDPDHPANAFRMDRLPVTQAINFTG
jgi:nitroreductase